MIEGMRIRKYLYFILFWVLSNHQALSAVDELQESLSPRGKVLVQCIAFYEAMVEVAKIYDPSVKEVYSFTSEGGPLPLSDIIYTQSLNRVRQFQRAFSDEFIVEAGDEIKEEYQRVYGTFIKEIETTFPNPNPEIDSSWNSCGKQGKWLHDRGIQRKGL